MKSKSMKLSVVLGLFAVFICSIFSASNILADDEVYSNSNGVELTQAEYDFVNEFYGNSFFNTMTEEEYEWIADLNLDEADVDIQKYIELPPIMPMSSWHATGSKEVSIAKSCNNVFCTMIVNAKWYVNPVVRSWDLIGARFENASLFDDDVTSKVVSSAGTQYYYNFKVLSNGVGASVKLPDTATNIRVELKFYLTRTTDTVFGSYQHAIQNISLSDSYKYYFNYMGEGNVFYLYGNAVGKYDQMAGVYINIP